MQSFVISTMQAHTQTCPSQELVAADPSVMSLVREEDGQTLLHTAASAGCLAGLGALLEAGASVALPTVGDQKGLNALMLLLNATQWRWMHDEAKNGPAQEAFSAAVRKLVAADPLALEHRDSRDRTPLWHALAQVMALREGANVGCVPLLLELGADVNAAVCGGLSYLQSAVQELGHLFVPSAPTAGDGDENDDDSRQRCICEVPGVLVDDAADGYENSARRRLLCISCERAVPTLC